MKLSTDRILTTHVGSLPRPQDVVDLIFAQYRGEPVDAARFETVVQRAVEDVIRPSAAQSCNCTSVTERGAAFVMAATTTSAASCQSINTGLTLEAMPLVKVICASQISPALDIAVETLVLRCVTVQKCTMVTESI